ncbi:MAG TPA: transposase [Terracidiphilus sp.]|nr:transposase [Terracidiphilus sp.]
MSPTTDSPTVHSITLVLMTRGLHRYQQTGNFHFITFSCYRRRPYLKSAARRRLFESALERIRKRYGFVVLGYIVMPEHVHLLVNEPKNGTLDRAIQALKLSVTVRQKQRPFWQPRYYDFNVWNPEKTTEKLRYMHRNPVKRGLVTKPADWEWSSFRHYMTGSEGTVQIGSFWTATKRGNQLPKTQVSNARPGAPSSL